MLITPYPRVPDIHRDNRDKIRNESFLKNFYFQFVLSSDSSWCYVFWLRCSRLSHHQSETIWWHWCNPSAHVSKPKRTASSKPTTTSSPLAPRNFCNTPDPCAYLMPPISTNLLQIKEVRESGGINAWHHELNVSPEICELKNDSKICHGLDQRPDAARLAALAYFG